MCCTKRLKAVGVILQYVIRDTSIAIEMKVVIKPPTRINVV